MAKKGKIQIEIEFWLARFLIFAFRILPLRTAIRVGTTVGRLGRVFRKLGRTAEQNLKLAFPESAPDERRRILRGCFENLGRLLAIFSHLTDRNPAALQALIRPEGLENLVAAEKSPRGTILFTGHIGAWELTSFGLSILGHPFSFLVRRIDNDRVEKLIDRARTYRGNRTIDKRLAAREMLQILRSGGTLGLLVDLNSLDREGIFVDFFGVRASTTFMLAKLALRTNADVLPVFAPWDKTEQQVRLQIGPPLAIERSGDEQEDVRRLTEAFTRVVEDYVRRYPDQWLWIHRRWKTRPPGEPEIYQ